VNPALQCVVEPSGCVCEGARPRLQDRSMCGPRSSTRDSRRLATRRERPSDQAHAAPVAVGSGLMASFLRMLTMSRAVLSDVWPAADVSPLTPAAPGVELVDEAGMVAVGILDLITSSKSRSSALVGVSLRCASPVRTRGPCKGFRFAIHAMVGAFGGHSRGPESRDDRAARLSLLARPRRGDAPQSTRRTRPSSPFVTTSTLPSKCTWSAGPSSTASTRRSISRAGWRQRMRVAVVDPNTKVLVDADVRSSCVASGIETRRLVRADDDARTAHRCR
jgi:hypothetical protein